MLILCISTKREILFVYLYTICINSKSLNERRKPMDVILKQSENKVGLYIDRKLATVLENKTIEQATDWIWRNLKNVKIHISK